MPSLEETSIWTEVAQKLSTNCTYMWELIKNHKILWIRWGSSLKCLKGNDQSEVRNKTWWKSFSSETFYMITTQQLESFFFKGVQQLESKVDKRRNTQWVISDQLSKPKRRVWIKDAVLKRHPRFQIEHNC